MATTLEDYQQLKEQVDALRMRIKELEEGSYADGPNRKRRRSLESGISVTVLVDAVTQSGIAMREARRLFGTPPNFVLETTKRVTLYRLAPERDGFVPYVLCGNLNCLLYSQAPAHGVVEMHKDARFNDSSEVAWTVVGGSQERVDLLDAQPQKCYGVFCTRRHANSVRIRVRSMSNEREGVLRSATICGCCRSASF